MSAFIKQVEDLGSSTVKTFGQKADGIISEFEVFCEVWAEKLF